MDDYFAKPFDREDLYRLLKRWCGGRPHRRRLSGHLQQFTS